MAGGGVKTVRAIHPRAKAASRPPALERGRSDMWRDERVGERGKPGLWGGGQPGLWGGVQTGLYSAQDSERNQTHTHNKSTPEAGHAGKGKRHERTWTGSIASILPLPPPRRGRPYLSKAKRVGFSLLPASTATGETRACRGGCGASCRACARCIPSFSLRSNPSLTFDGRCLSAFAPPGHAVEVRAVEFTTVEFPGVEWWMMVSERPSE